MISRCGRLIYAAGDVYSLMETWRGHFPITNFVRQALRRKQVEAEADSEAFSRAEGVLFNACEFWAAVASRELAAYLGSNSVSRLLVAFEAFSEIGAVRVASALRIVIGGSPEAPSSKWVQQQAAGLETRLLDTEDAVDHLIARYASDTLTDHPADGPRVNRSAQPRSTEG